MLGITIKLIPLLFHLNLFSWFSGFLTHCDAKYYPDDDDPITNEKVYLEFDKKSYTINSPSTSRPNYTSVTKWTITGDSDCIPQIACPEFDLSEAGSDGTCETALQQLEVTDGIYGKETYCGTKGPSGVRPSNHDGLRDLYITFRNNAKKREANFECTLKCGKKGATPLPDKIVPKVNERCYCGQKPMKNRIIGGHDTYYGEFPWMAAMVVAKTRQPFCIGSVINDRMILTAGHCFKGKFRQAENMQVVLNGNIMDQMPNINVIKDKKEIQKIKYKTYDADTLKDLDSGNGSFRFNVDKIWIHPLYISDTSDFDTAVMILSKPIDAKAFKAYSPLCLPELKQEVDLYTRKEVVISGWGLPSTTAPGTNTVMTQITLTVLPHQRCKELFGKRMVSSKRQLCAEHWLSGKEDSCAGDSGGPLILQDRPQVWYQVGIISWGDSCAVPNKPGIYYRTTSTNQWIRHMSNAKQAVWCEVPD